jgi:ABC-2 type transport system permease protein
VLTAPSATAVQLRDHHELLYMLGIPALVPVMLAAYAVVGERQEGTLEPVLSTPIRREELLLGKALAVLLPSVGVAYLVFGVFLALVGLFAYPGVPSALVRRSDLLAQVIFTPLVAGWSIWIAVAISTRASDIRVAQQLSVLASVTTVAVSTLVAFDASSTRRSRSGSASARRTARQPARLAPRIGAVRPRAADHQHPVKEPLEPRRARRRPA